MKIAYLGPTNTYTEIVAKNLFNNSEYFPMTLIRNVVNAVENDEVDFGVIPLENFYNGEVRETLDSLTNCLKTSIVMESSIKIEHCLGALKNHSNITKIISKDQAIEQSGAYLLENYPFCETICVSSTSEAVNIIKRDNLLDSAAIASEKAINDLGLIIIAKNICSNNKTRFIVIGKNKTKPTGNDKTFIAIHPHFHDRPGVLYHTLGFLSGLNINLDYIQSRPDGNCGYYFYIEMNGHIEDLNVKTAINAIRLSLDPLNQHPDVLKILGSYPNTDWKK